MEILTIIFIIIIAFLSLWILFRLLGYGGFVGRSLANIGYGTVIIGVSQVMEEIDYFRMTLGEDGMRITHHIIFIIGLCIVAWGFKNLMEKRKRDEDIDSGIKTM